VAHELEVTLSALSVGDPLEDFPHPLASLATRSALAAGLVLVELDEIQCEVDGTGLVVDENDRPTAQHGARIGQRLERQGDLEVLGPDHGRGGATRDDGTKLEAFPQTAGEAEQCRHGGTHGHLEDPWIVEFARHAEHAGSRTVGTEARRRTTGSCGGVYGGIRRSDGSVPFRAMLNNQWYVREGLYVIDHGRAAVEASLGWKRRLEAGLSTPTL